MTAFVRAAKPKVWVVLILLAGGTVRADSAKPAAKAAAKSLHAVEVITDVVYYDGPGAHPTKHRLDMYLPKDVDDFPVLFFVHGGAWRHGDKNFFGVYANLGKYWATRGVGAVVTNYRLSPGVKHPEHVKDVARAFAWTVNHIADYGGDPDAIFVCGHSAGGHLAALLAMDERYLKAEGVDAKAIKGVMPISGVYQIPEISGLFNAAFGPDPAVRRDASPVSHANPGLPPFLLVYAENDLPYCGQSSAEALAKVLRARNIPVQLLEVKDGNHVGEIVNASKDGDPIAEAFREFMDGRLKMAHP